MQPGVPGHRPDHRQPVGRKRAHARPVPRPRRHPPQGERPLRGCRDRVQPAVRQPQAAGAELERARYPYALVEHAHRDLRPLEIQRPARSAQRRRVRPAVALGGDDRKTHPEAGEQFARVDARREHDHACADRVRLRLYQPPATVPTQRGDLLTLAHPHSTRFERSRKRGRELLGADAALPVGDHPTDHARVERGLQIKHLAGGQALQRVHRARFAEVAGDLPDVLQLRAVKGGVQQRLIVALELHPPLGQPVKRRSGQRRGALEGYQTAAVGRARTVRDEPSDPGQQRRRQCRANPQRTRRIQKPP